MMLPAAVGKDPGVVNFMAISRRESCPESMTSSHLWREVMSFVVFVVFFSRREAPSHLGSERFGSSQTGMSLPYYSCIRSLGYRELLSMMVPSRKARCEGGTLPGTLSDKQRSQSAREVSVLVTTNRRFTDSASRLPSVISRLGGNRLARLRGAVARNP